MAMKAVKSTEKYELDGELSSWVGMFYFFCLLRTGMFYYVLFVSFGAFKVINISLTGQLLDCSLAKPPADKKDDTVSVPSVKGGPLLHAPLGYGMPRPDPYGAPPAYGVPPAYGGQVDHIF